MVTERPGGFEVAPQFRALGICWLVYGVLLIAGAIWLIFFEPTATMMFGALLGRVADPFAMMSAFHLFYAVAVLGHAACGALGIVAGAMLAAGRRSGRMLATLAAFCSLWNVPLGTALGTYTLIVMIALAPRPTSKVFPASRTAPLNRESTVTP